MSIPPGSRIGRYEIRASLGAGGMGEVYLAHDSDLERDVAVKVLRGSDAGGDRVRRFIQEAKAASALNHPNVAHVYEIGSHDDLHFIAMEVVEGETLRDRLLRGTMAFDDVLHLGSQIAAGLAAAHRAGIVHRDVKPENVIIRPDGYAKILDFGLAKLREIRADDAPTLLKTEPGVTMGTLGYMAPEQLSGGDITPAADVFSLGVVLYELVSGRRPFGGATATEIISAILSKAPPPLHEQRADVPPKLELVIAKALSKNVGDRYATAGEMSEELRQISREVTSPGITVGSDSQSPAARSRNRKIAAALVVLAVIAAAAVWMFRSKQERSAEDLVTIAEGHLERRQFTEAYETAVAAAAILPENDRLRDVIATAADKATIESDPPGATVFLQRYGGPEERTRAGTTPLTIPRLPHGDYIVSFEKERYAPALRPLATAPHLRYGGIRAWGPVALRLKMVEAAAIEPGMVHVEGGDYRLVGWSRPSDRMVALSDFFIDRFEVSNREFEEFVRAGGYRRRDLWKYPFVEGAKTLSFEEAMTRFRDATGLPGPRNWSQGAHPPALENHPVTGVTWYEAAAFAEGKGKQLPTVYQWEKAARLPGASAGGSMLPWGLVPLGVDTSDRANFTSKGTMPVDSMPFGLSPWGAYHMAGNVWEWCRNEKAPGFALRGGGWSDAVYAFGATGAFPRFYSSATVGFRCVKEIAGRGDDQGGFALAATEVVPEYHPVDDKTFEEIRRRYDYVRDPLNAKVIETSETSAWRVEKITYMAGGQSVPAYLYLPKGSRPPFQVVHFSPSGDVVSGFRTLDAAVEMWVGPAIRAGRAAFAVVMEGYLGRPWAADAQPVDPRTAEWADETILRVTELRRGLDYLETRNDIDTSRIAFVAYSAGSGEGVLLTGLEPRYRSVMLIGSGIHARVPVTPAANRINFAPRISGPKLMLHGRYDETAPFKTVAEPLFRLLREPKRLELYEGGHGISADVMVPALQKWLDETLGPVE